MGQVTITYEIITCWCGIPIALPTDLYRMNREDGNKVYCAVGHTCVPAKPELAEAQARISQLNARLDQEKAARAHTERQLSATKGVVTRTKKRIGKGTCPCCNRHFVNVERHMATQHPEYANEEH